jgi:hypothetical protein
LIIGLGYIYEIRCPPTKLRGGDQRLGFRTTGEYR